MGLHCRWHDVKYTYLPMLTIGICMMFSPKDKRKIVSRVFPNFVLNGADVQFVLAAAEALRKWDGDGGRAPGDAVCMRRGLTL